MFESFLYSYKKTKIEIPEFKKPEFKKPTRKNRINISKLSQIKKKWIQNNLEV